MNEDRLCSPSFQNSNGRMHWCGVAVASTLTRFAEVTHIDRAGKLGYPFVANHGWKK